jgi:hypothetical protein
MAALREVFKIGKGFDGWSTDLHNLCWATQKGRPIYCLFTISLNLSEQLKGTAFLGSRIKSSPVAGFLTSRSFVIVFLLQYVIFGNILHMLPYLFEKTDGPKFIASTLTKGKTL